MTRLREPASTAADLDSLSYRLRTESCEDADHTALEPPGLAAHRFATGAFNGLGEGRCFGGFGELLQGMLPSGDRFLVNLKIDRVSRARLAIGGAAECLMRGGHDTGVREKSARAVASVLAEIGASGLQFRLEVESTIPIGKGLSSSTADMVASLRALSSAASLPLPREFISRVITAIEPNDGLHYPGTAVYLHTRGVLLRSFEHVPAFDIIGIDQGGEVDTVAFNQRAQQFSESVRGTYQEQLTLLCTALAEADDEAVAEVATRSTRLWQALYAKELLEPVEAWSKATSALGIVNTHTGTYLGVLFKRGQSDIDELVRRARAAFPSCAVDKFSTVRDL